MAGPIIDHNVKQQWVKLHATAAVQLQGAAPLCVYRVYGSMDYLDLRYIIPFSFHGADILTRL